MLFNSFQFLLFFPIVTLLYYILPHRFRWLHLLIASCIFYMAFIPIYIFILFVTIIVDYIAGILIEKESGRRRRLFLIVSIVVNMGFLAFFKYYNFFTENVNELLHLLHVSTHPIPLLNFILPVGLSFHTFQAMSYTIEVYRGNQKAERHFGIYALYVMFYPQLVAGPIERPQNLLHQFHEEHKFSSQNLLDGLRQMLWGFFKKVVIADRLALYVNLVYANPQGFHYWNLLIAVFCFSIQIYCDFSGYSDIALGAAKTMGFNLMTNFNRPFLYSTNITEFWRRWHISLYTWFTDYVYSPMVIAYRDYGRWGITGAIMITFLLSGLWHGANWTFIVFGLLHGIALVYEALTKKSRKQISKRIPSTLYRISSIVITFLVLNFIWIFFRADTVSDALLIIKRIFTHYNAVPFKTFLMDFKTGSEYGLSLLGIAGVMMVLMMIAEAKLSTDLSNMNKRPMWDIFLCTFILTCIILLGVTKTSNFIYFQF